MRKYYPSFLDKKTGLEIQSTPLAQLGSVFTQVLFVASLGFLGFRMVERYGTDWLMDPLNYLAYRVRNEVDFILILTLMTVGGGIAVGLIYVGVVSRVGNWVHDGIARWQHHHRQKGEAE
jgi:hypothetical protein